MNFSQNFKKPFLAVCSVAVLSTSATYAAVCNDEVKYAIGGYRMSFQQSRCKLSYKPSACQALSAEQVLNETTVAPFLSFSVDGNEISYYTGNGNNADGTLLARPNSMSPMKFDPATYTFDLNSLGGKSAQFSSSKSLDLAFAAGNMETNKRMAINLKFDNIQSYCSDSGSSECKLNVSFLPLYLYNGKSLQQRGDPLFICLQDINIVKGVDIRASLEPTTQQYACNHQIKSGNFYTITNRTDSAKFTITLNKSQISQDFALIYDVVGNNADGLTAFPWKLEYSEQACFVPQKPNTPPPTPAIEHNSTFNFSPRIIEKRSFGYIMGGKLAGNLSVAWSAQGSTKNTLSTDQREIISITLKDGNGKDAPWASKIGWIFHPHIMANLYTGKCKAEWITTGDEFDGVGTFNVSNKTRYIMKALHGRDLDDPSSDVAGSGSNPELNALYNEVHEKYQNILKGCSNSFGEMRVGIDDDGGFHSHMSYSLFDFRVKNAPGINYENMEISVTYMDGNKKVTEKAVFTARPDRLVFADKDKIFTKATTAYRVDCESGKDCYNPKVYPISGLEYKINKSSNTGYQKTNPLPLEHNLVAVDINGKIVDTYTKTIPATIVNASNNIVINGIKHNLGNANVGVEAVFENGVGYIRTPGKDYFKYDKSGHTFVQIIDNSVSGDCLAGKFNNTFWETYGYGVDDMMIRPIGCDTVLIPKPQSVAKAARTIFQRNYNRFNNVYGFATNDFDTSNSAESSGDFWYIFSPTSIKVSHTNSDYFPNMTYYDDLTDSSNVSFLDANGSINNKRKRQNLVYANLDLNITAYNGDGSIAGAYTSGQFETLSSRPYDKRFPNRNKPRQGLANDFNMTVILNNTNLKTMQMSLRTKDINLFNYSPSDTFGSFGTDLRAAFEIKRDAFKVGTSFTRAGVNLNRKADQAKNPQIIQGNDFDLDFSEIIKPSSIANIPTNAQGKIIDLNTSTHDVVRSTPQGNATFFYGRLFVPNYSFSVKNTPYEVKYVYSYYSVYCSLVNCHNIYPSVVSNSQSIRATSGYWINNSFANQFNGVLINETNSTIRGVHGFDIFKPYLTINGATSIASNSGIDIQKQSMIYTKPLADISKAGDVYKMKETPLFTTEHGTEAAVFLLSYDLVNVSSIDGFVPYEIVFTNDAPGDAIWHGAGSQGAVLGIDENKTTRSRSRMSR